MILALPAVVLLGVSVAAPHKLLDIVYKAKLATAAPAFGTLVLAMVCLCVTVVLTVYLLGVGWRWVVLLLALGTGTLILLTLRAHGHYVDTARADLLTQAGLALALALSLMAVHRRSGRHWSLIEGGDEEGQSVVPASESAAQGREDQGPVSESGYRGAS
jgi:hypothetical protein